MMSQLLQIKENGNNVGMGNESPATTHFFHLILWKACSLNLVMISSQIKFESKALLFCKIFSYLMPHLISFHL